MPRYKYIGMLNNLVYVHSNQMLMNALVHHHVVQTVSVLTYQEHTDATVLEATH